MQESEIIDERYQILWKGFAVIERCSDAIPVSSDRQLKQLARGTANNPDVSEFLLWDRKENKISETVNPIIWKGAEDFSPESFFENWEDEG